MTAERVTYATLAAGRSEEFKRRFDLALQRVRRTLGGRHPHIIDGQEAWGGPEFEDRSPIDTRSVLGTFPGGTAEEIDKAVAAARRAFPYWSHLPWQERTA